MQKHDRKKVEITDFLTALCLLSRLPVKVNPQSGDTARSAWAWPLVGAMLGGIAALIGAIALWSGLPATIAATTVLSGQIVLTGAMHEDGLADTADGLWGGWDRARRLEIMKDSRIGTYGVIALALSLLVRWAALLALMQAGWLYAPLIAAGAISRALMAAMMHALPGARNEGLSASVGHPSRQIAGIAAALGLALALLAVGSAAVWAVVSAGCAMLVLASMAQRKIGGQTGDILGAAQQLAEITVLSVLAATLT